MKEVSGDLWTYPADWRGITTNGFVKTNGALVMGRGCAKEARDKIPDLDAKWGAQIKYYGNVVMLDPENKLFTFPVKHRWWEDADLELIEESAKNLGEITRGDPEGIYLLPRPGCGNGGLNWEDVKPLLEDLPDNVLVITNE
jgi:hypothetical protein